VLLGAAACQSPSSQRQQLSSTNPLDQVRAAVWLADAGDKDAVARLVGLLEDRDETVRMYAILALERLCGQTHGYKYYAPDAERAVAVARWREALRKGEVTTERPPTASAPASSAPAGACAAAEPGDADTQ
jgi:HEAT repeat protein